MLETFNFQHFQRKLKTHFLSCMLSTVIFFTTLFFRFYLLTIFCFVKASCQHYDLMILMLMTSPSRQGTV